MEGEAITLPCIFFFFLEVSQVFIYQKAAFLIVASACASHGARDL